MTFALITLLAALSLAAVADWFSIIGFMTIYAANPMHALIMGIVLALAKLVTTSWVYRNWKFADWKLKTPLIGFVVALMVATSIGTYGFLTKSHLDQGGGTIDNGAKVERLEQQIAREKSVIVDDEKVITQLDATINSYIGKDRTDKSLAVRKSQAPQRKQLRDDIDASQKRIDTFSDERLKLQSEVRKQQLDVGPIRYIAELFYGVVDDATKNIEAAVRIFTLLITSTLDPLAVILLVAANHTLLRIRDEKENTIQETESDAGYDNQRDHSFNEEIISEGITPTSDISKENRMDIGLVERSSDPATKVPVHSEVFPEIMVDVLDEEKGAYTEKSDILSEYGTTMADVSAPIAEHDAQVIEPTTTPGSNPEIPKVIHEEEAVVQDEESSAEVLPELPVRLQDKDEVTEGNTSGDTKFTWPKIQIQVLDEKEETILERPPIIRASAPVAFIRSPRPTRVSIGEVTTPITSDAPAVETPVHAQVDVAVPTVVIENSVLRELSGSRSHFIPQKVNEEEKHTQIETQGTDTIVFADRPQAARPAAPHEKIFGEGQKIGTEETKVQITHEGDQNNHTAAKYPVTLSWLTEFKRSQNG